MEEDRNLLEHLNIPTYADPIKGTWPTTLFDPVIFRTFMRRFTFGSTRHFRFGGGGAQSARSERIIRESFLRLV